MFNQNEIYNIFNQKSNEKQDLQRTGKRVRVRSKTLAGIEKSGFTGIFCRIVQL